MTLGALALDPSRYLSCRMLSFPFFILFSFLFSYILCWQWLWQWWLHKHRYTSLYVQSTS